MEIIFDNYILENKESKVSFRINHNKLTGVTGYNYNNILDAIQLRKIGTGNLLINDIKVNKKNINVFRKRISIIDDKLVDNFYLITVKDLMNEEIKENDFSLNNANKKIIDSLKIVGLTEEYLNRTLITLSSYEKKLILLARGLLSNPNLIIVKEPFKGIDLSNEKKLINFYNKIKEQYQKTIIFISNDIDMLYKYTEEIIICKNEDILAYGKTNDVFEKIDFLKRNKIEIPEILEISHLAIKKKNIKLSYHKDIRDIIKDIYKHV